ncbi:MAG: carboxypeptidase regulatory-like domain-containing protein [Terracidiphilus sp.]
MALKKTLFALALMFLAAAGPVFGQSDRGTITGTVKDASAAVLPGVQVTVVNAATNEAWKATTDGLGLYRAENLPVGTYSVRFTYQGFKTLERRGVTLLIGQVAEIDASLQVGGTTETVEVTSASPILETEDSAVGANLNSEAVSELPLNSQGSRNLSNFIFAYVPGAEGSDYSSHIDGGMALTKEVLIDGTSAVSQLGGYISESQPPMEAVQEFEADTAGISADAGRSGGGVFRYEMKSGTNQIHGSLFGFVHSTSLDAVSASNHLSAITDPANAAAYLKISDSLSDWGGSEGGAIKKDKLFYFFAFERYMQSMWNVGPNSRTVPTDAMMGLTSNGSVATYADLSPMLSPGVAVDTYGGSPAIDNCGNPVYKGAIIDPASTGVTPVATANTPAGFGCVFVNNQIPTGRISKVTSQILQLYHQYYKPESTLTTNDAGPAYQPDPWFHNTQTSFKMDYNISPKQHLAGSFYWDDYPRINADQGGVWSPTAADGGPMANSYWHNTTAPGARLSDAMTISPNMVNTAYATFNRFRNPSIAVSETGDWDKKLVGYNGAGNFPLIYFDSGMYFGGANYQNGWSFSPLGSQYNDFYAGNTFIYSDELVWSHRRNNFKFGAEFRAMQFNYHTDDNTFTGGYPLIFDPTNTAPAWYDINAYDQVGNAFGSFLLGDVYNAETNNPDNEYGRRKVFSVYASDDIRVNSRLTLNVSLRWDYNNPYKEKYGHWSNFVLNALNPVTGEYGEYQYLTSGSQSFEKRQDYYNYSPHIGIAYKLTDKTVARANFGVFFTPLNLNTWGGVPYQQDGDEGFHPITQEGNFEWDNGYSPTSTQVKTPDYTQADVVSVDPRSLTPGNVQQYSIGVQRQLDRVSLLDANWVQSHSYHLQSGIFQTNQPTEANYQNYVTTGEFPASYNGYWGGAGPGWEGLTPYPQAEAGYGPMLSVGVPLGNSDYKSIQVSVTRRSAHGLSLMGSYNWSRTHGDVDSDFQELWWSGALQNTYDLKDEAKDISDFDETHIVKGYIIYNLPFGQGKTFASTVGSLGNAFIGGWSLDGDFHYNTGTPISVHSTNSYVGFNSVYANITSGCKLTTGSRKLFGQYLNTSCFTNPNPGAYGGAAPQFGNGGNFQSQVRNPGLATEDLGVHKSLAVGPEGRYNFTLRLEFFNVFNRDALGGPDTNMADGTFGQIISYGGVGGRVGQFGARFTF